MPKEPFEVFVVWAPSYTTDNTGFAETGAKIFKDKRVKQYWDQKVEVSGGYGKLIPLPRDAPLAYDVYFYFAKNQVWEDTLPMPKEYMHQVFDDGKWFDPEKFMELVKAELKQP